jgi:signal transduction histidine kinase
VSDPVQNYTSKNLRILTAVNTEAISRATSRVMYLIFSILFMMSLLSFFITRHFFQKKLALPLEALTHILKDQNTNLEKLKTFLSQSFFYEVSVIGESVNTLWLRLFASEKERERQARYVAIAQAMQMLAHDIRKPFSMVKITLMILKKSRSIEDMKTALSTSESQILRAISHVDGLLEDVIEIDRNSQLNLKEVEFRSLLLSVIQDLSSTDPAPKVALRAQFEHSGKMIVDSLRISRVLSNILTNAIEALKGVGHISISTQDILQNNQPMILVEIQNNGPLIPDNIRSNLFDAFFTSGKPEGTGLGLAIAKKIVESHGGQIACRSSEKEGVVFSFTVNRKVLPLSSLERRESKSATEHGSFPDHF